MTASRWLQLGEIARRLGGELEGGDDVVVTSAAPIELAGPQQITFLAGGRRGAVLPRTRATCVLVSRGMVGPPGCSVIRVDDPRLAFARVLEWLHPRPAISGVHPTAIVHATAHLGANVGIGPYCVVGANCTIGDDTVLHARVTLYDGVVIGRRCLLHAGAVIGADGFGFAPAGDHLQKIPQVGGVEIDDNVEIGANSTIDRGTMVATRIGAGTKIDNLVHVAHNCVVGRNVVIAAQTGVAGGAVIGDGAVIGGQVGIGDRVQVEPGAIIGAASAVPTGKHIRAGEPVWGVPARPLRRYLRQLASLGRLEAMRAQLRDQRAPPGPHMSGRALHQPAGGAPPRSSTSCS
ncbi:MAG TPA: UDP-3-O-(3-hydroxymyristoyl)glucosamine N-acyltransferase [Planctomycetota bacterium]